ncbi:MAG: hypothetical protein A3A43_01650 [Candidatus Liptonbacteria bacterium RIFCSPLOWO2_01_FULL_56_20]|uniref:Uncharacterized protein n=1 Tax=Candidatus Liptonbacteria bacterium RIFCSPLOWO2_01_FULL_56_20 TaxID=1798652 RepID=A0A1G2CJL3_9BACT|nr:MAG: Protein containing Heat shock protein Hsp20 protein [Parcubacteria group bacterium GW2011_GWB1_56_8]OGY97904.1 MAG: hypothetical protein A2681_00935 [Candidatus Liptonbacteria bacterium RIFCSPHIGHO2_01_FULL_56_18b]OGZ01593.1 MAG: hypothetical protein A3A43_01650 [Candidatus Liptonbacteria bacterium RIFCSPLOWO2_01_FULL_56_20]
MVNSEDRFFEELARSHSPGIQPAVKLTKSGAPVPRREKHAKPHDKMTTKPLERERDEPEPMDEGPEGQLTIDVYQTPNDIIIESAIAGVRPDDLDIDVTTDAVMIRGKRRRESPVKDEDYFYQECYWGRFSRSIILPQEIDADESTVSLKNGILTVKLPKLNRKKTKKLRVRVD